MDHLHAMLRAMRVETKARDHTSVIREFLAHLDQAFRTPPRKSRRDK